MEKKLSEELSDWRAERPDEWKMDEFIRKAKKIEAKLQNTSSNNDYAKLPTIEECYQAIPFPSNERDCAMFVAGIADCHKFVSRHFA